MGKFDNPEVSIVMPSKNTSKYIRESIDSILVSSFHSFELIVVDDHSTDETPNIVNSIRDQRIILLKNKGNGVAHALNTGYSSARGNIFMRCDSDDLFTQDKIASQVKWLENNSDYIAIAGAYCSITETGDLVADFSVNNESREVTHELRAGKIPIHMCATGFRSYVWSGIGMARPFFITSSDIDIMLRIGEFGRFWFENTLTYRLRMRHSSITHTSRTPTIKFYGDTALLFQQQRISRGYDDLDRGIPPVPPSKDLGKYLYIPSQISSQLVGRAWQAWNTGDKANGIKCIFRALYYSPYKWAVWRSASVMIIRFVLERLFQDKKSKGDK